MNAEMDYTWIILREPGCVPQRKGPFRPHQVKQFLLELFEARPTALVTVLSGLDACGPSVSDGPEWLEVSDRRYRSRAQRHRETSRAAWAGSHQRVTSHVLSELEIAAICGGANAARLLRRSGEH